MGVEAEQCAQAAGAVRATGSGWFKAGASDRPLDAYRGALRSARLGDAEVTVVHAKVAGVRWKRGDWAAVAVAAGRSQQRPETCRVSLSSLHSVSRSTRRLRSTAAPAPAPPSACSLCTV